MAEGTPLRVRLDADTKPYRRGMQSAGKDTSKFAKGASGAIKGVGLAFGGLALAFGAAAVNGIQKFAELDKKVREVGTLLGDVNDQDLSQLTDEIERVAQATGQAATEVATSFYDSISAGIPRDRVEEFVGDAAKFATAGGTEIGAATDLLTSAINAFGLEAGDAGAVSDVFFGAVKAGKTTVDELGSAFFNVGPIANAMNVGLEESAGWLSALTLQGTPTSVAATQVKAALAELGKAGSKADVVFQDIVGKSFPEFLEGGGTLEQALSQLSDGAEANGKSMTEVFGSIEAAQAVMAIAGPNFDTFSGIVSDLGDSAGVTDQAFETMSGSVEFQQARLREQFDAILRSIGEAFIPVLKGAMAFISDTVVPLIGEYWPIALGKAKDAFSAIGTFLETTLVPIWENVLQPALTTAWETINNDLIPAVRDWLPEAFAAVVAVVKNDLMPIWNDDLLPALKAVQKFIMDPLIPAIEEIIGAVTEFYQDSIAPLLEKLGTWISDLEGLDSAIKLAAAAIGIIALGVLAFNITMAIATAIAGAFTVVMGVLLSPVLLIIAAVALLVAGAVLLYKNWTPLRVFIHEKFIPALKALWEGLQSLWKGAGELKTKFLATWRSLWDGLKGIINSIIGGLEAIPNAFIGGINQMVRAWNNFSFGTPAVEIAGHLIVPSFRFETPDISKIPAVHLPRLAQGGIVSGATLALIGEGGEPEVVAPLSDLRGMLGGGRRGMPSFQVFITNAYGDRTSLGESVVDALEEHVRVNGPLPAHWFST